LIKEVAALAYNVLLATALAYILWFTALKKLSGSIVRISTLIIAVLGMVGA
jgi:drug/metabolite transporter (DMT)-like permease